MRCALTMLLIMMPLLAKAQFSIVDSKNHEPLPGVYVFAANGTLLDMSDEKGQVTKAEGMVTLSMLSYEALHIDASKAKGTTVELTEQPLQLNEIVVKKTDFVKISGTFRDVVLNFGKVVMYREGLMDFYYDKKAKDYKRRIRACRQYEHPDLRDWSKNDSLNIGLCPTFDLGKVQTLKTEGSEDKGDTTMIWAMRGKELVKDGAMMFKQNGLLRVIIDGVKFAKRTSISFLGMRMAVNKVYTDWTYREDAEGEKNLVALRNIVNEDFQWSKKSPVIKIECTQDFVVNDITYLTKKQAKEEMKDKETETEHFTITNCLPTLPKVITDQIPTMKRTKRRDS